MKLTILCLLLFGLFATVLCVGQEEAQSSETAKRSCRRICGYVRIRFKLGCCRWEFRLVWRCRTRCGRELEEAAVEIPFPSRFEAYDPDNDGVISEKEFLKTTGADEKSGHDAFVDSDKDGDGKLDKNEFAKAPLKKATDDV